MKADFFIDRPVFSTVLSIIIVIVGAIGLALPKDAELTYSVREFLNLIK